MWIPLIKVRKNPFKAKQTNAKEEQIIIKKLTKSSI